MFLYFPKLRVSLQPSLGHCTPSSLIQTTVGCRVGVDTEEFFSTGVGVLLPCDGGATALFLDGCVEILDVFLAMIFFLAGALPSYSESSLAPLLLDLEAALVVFLN